MTFYDDMQGVATDLLQQFAQGTVILVKMTPGAGPPENPGPDTPTNYLIPGATASGVKLSYVQRGLAMASDLQVIAQVTAVQAEMTDRLSIDGMLYKFRQIIQIPSAGTPVAFVYIVHAGNDTVALEKK